MLRVVVCDDQPEVLLRVVEMIDTLWTREHETIGLFSWEALIHHLTHEAPGQVDILLLDVQLGEQNGIQLSTQFLSPWPWMRVIFMTGYAEYCEEIFQSTPSGFLLKPIKPDRLLFALDKAAQEREADCARTLSVLNREQQGVQIPLAQIRYLESKNRVVRIHAGEQTLECSRRLDGLELELPCLFVRCHQNYVLNLAYVRKIVYGKAELTDGTKIPISRAKIQSVRNRLMDYIQKGI